MSGSDSDFTKLVTQLADLHRGRGIRRPKAGEWFQDPLRKAVGLTATMSEADAVRRAFASLKDATRGLPEDLRVVFLVASGIASQGRLLQDRLAEASMHLDRGERTVQRRLADANAMVAAVLLRRLQGASTGRIDAGWYVDAMTSTVRLDRARPEFIGVREIVATQRVPEITENISIPRPDRGVLADEIEVEALEGCVLHSLERTSASSWHYRLALPEVLETGDRHRYGVLVRIPSASFIKPYAVIVPVRECRAFTVRVHFDPERAPRPVFLADGLFPAVLEDEPSGPEVDIDSAGMTSASFSNLGSGLAYGLRWSWPAGPAGDSSAPVAPLH